RNECGFVIAVEVATVREFHVHRPNHREANAVYPNRLADGGQTAEQLLFQPRTQKYDTPAFLDIFRGDPTALRGHLIAHFTVLGINTPGRGFGKPLLVRNPLPTHSLQGHALDEWRLRLHPVGILLLEPHFLACPLSSRLLTRRARPANDSRFPEHLKGIEQNAAKSGTIT